MSRSLPMSRARRSRQSGFFIILLAIFAVIPLTANSAGSTHPPLELDVPFVPTPPEVVEKMLQMADIKSSDFLIDLGAGDGRIAVAAVRDFGARGALGVDLDPERVAEARANAQQAGVDDRVTFEVENLFQTDFSRATVVSMYLLPGVNIELRPKVLEMAPGTRIVSHAFSMGEWESDAHENVDGREVYFWMVPAQAAGQWQVTGSEGDFTIDLKQNFQKITGTAKGADDVSLPLSGTLRGDVILLDIDEQGGAAPRRYMGLVKGDSIVALDDEGTVQGWRASRR